MLDGASFTGNTHEGRKLNALRGIGWALLAVDDRLGGLLDAAGDVNGRLAAIAAVHEEIADAAARVSSAHRPAAGRWRLRGRRRAVPAVPADGAVLGNGQVLSAAETALVAAAVGEASARRRSPDTSGCAACCIARGRARDNGVPDSAADLEQCRFHARHTEQSAVLASIRSRFPEPPCDWALEGIKGTGKNSAVRRRAHGFLRRHPDAVISVVDGKSTDTAAWAGGGVL
jgi:hypothetical protein